MREIKLLEKLIDESEFTLDESIKFEETERETIIVRNDQGDFLFEEHSAPMIEYTLEFHGYLK